MRLLLLALLVAAPLTAQQQPPEVTRLYQAGVGAAERGDLRAGAAYMDSVLAIDPTLLDALWNVGLWRAELGDPQTALTAWRTFHAMDSTDWRVEAKLIQTYQALEDTVHRDSALAGLLRHRALTKNPELKKAAEFCREQTLVRGHRLMVFHTFAPKGERMVYWTFYLLGEDGRDTARYSLGSYDFTTQVAREAGSIGPKERIYHLDYYASRNHATLMFYRAQPSYDDVRQAVLASLRGEISPASSSTLPLDGV